MTRDLDPTKRFSDRVDDYERYRPTYPAALFDWLEEGLRAGADAADLGAGTGLVSEALLARGCRMTLVEPNAEMLARARQRLGASRGATYMDGRAEATGLADASIDWVIAAQAFHWFEPVATRAELRRVLRPGGKVALVWNDRGVDDPLMRDYATWLGTWGRPGPSYPELLAGPALARFFGGPFVARSFTNTQRVDEQGLLGRVFSSSATPMASDPRRESAAAAARQLFAEHATGGVVTLRYETRGFVGELPSP